MKKGISTWIGLITGLLMIAISLAIYYYKRSFENNFEYVPYLIYIAGIVYALNRFKSSPADNKSFKNFFSEGFKTFIVVTLLMVVFTWIFLKANPGFQDQIVESKRESLIKDGQRTLPEIEEKMKIAKQNFITYFTAGAILGYLAIGSLATVIGSLFFSQQESAEERRKNQKLQK